MGAVEENFMNPDFSRLIVFFNKKYTFANYYEPLVIQDCWFIKKSNQKRAISVIQIRLDEPCCDIE